MERAKSECICGSRRHNSKWIKCNCCKQWYHLTCGRVGEDELDRIVKFICFKCTKRDGAMLTTYRCNECAGCVRQHDCDFCEACQADPKMKCLRRYCAIETNDPDFKYPLEKLKELDARPHKKPGRKKKNLDTADLPGAPKKRGRKKKNPDGAGGVANSAVNNNDIPLLLPENIPVLRPENVLRIPSAHVPSMLPRNLSNVLPVVPVIPPEFPRAKRNINCFNYFSSESSSEEEKAKATTWAERQYKKRGRKKKVQDENVNTNDTAAPSTSSFFESRPKRSINSVNYDSCDDDMPTPKRQYKKRAKLSESAPPAPSTPKKRGRKKKIPDNPPVVDETNPPVAETKCELNSFSLEGVAEFIQKNNPKNVIFLCGAGISTSAGIPDFRTPGTGLYANLEKYNLDRPEDIFSIELFEKDPEPFFDLAKSLFSSDVKPTATHYFMRLMVEKGLVRRIYTQNIDILEYLSGTPADKIVTTHGSHYTSTCQTCKVKYDQDWFANHLRFSTELIARCDKCITGIVKPDIVFFREDLPQRFYNHVAKDFAACDLLIIIGTSLVVYPVAGLVRDVKPHVPRLLINREAVGSEMLLYNQEDNKRDVFYEGSADVGVKKLAELLGWTPELDQMIEHEWTKLDAQFAKMKIESSPIVEREKQIEPNQLEDVEKKIEEIEPNQVEDVRMMNESNQHEEIGMMVEPNQHEEMEKKIEPNQLENVEKKIEEIEKHIEPTPFEDVRMMVEPNQLEDVEKKLKEIESNHLEDMEKQIESNQLEDVGIMIECNQLEEMGMIIESNQLEAVEEQIECNQSKEMEKQIEPNQFEEMAMMIEPNVSNANFCC